MIIPEIGECAGKIWHLLQEKGALNIKEIKKETDMDEVCILLGLGWLARENKVQFTFKGDIVYAELNYYHEHYF